MEKLKKEWKTVLIAFWLMAITIALFFIHAKLFALDQKSLRLSSTLDSVESVVLSTDAGLNHMSKKVQSMDTNMDFIKDKMRRK